MYFKLFIYFYFKLNIRFYENTLMFLIRYKIFYKRFINIVFTQNEI